MRWLPVARRSHFFHPAPPGAKGMALEKIKNFCLTSFLASPNWGRPSRPSRPSWTSLAMQKHNDMGTQTERPPAVLDTATGLLRPPPATTGGTPFKPGWLRHPAGKTFGGGTHAVPATVAQPTVIPLSYPPRSPGFWRTRWKIRSAPRISPSGPAANSRGGCTAARGSVSPAQDVLFHADGHSEKQVGCGRTFSFSMLIIKNSNRVK